MNPDWLLSPWMITVAIGMSLTGAGALLISELRAHALAAKVRSVLRQEEPPRRGGQNLALLIMGGLRRLGEKLRETAFFSRSDIAELERTVAACGLDTSSTASAVIGAKLLLFVIIPAGVYAFSIMQEWSSTNQLVSTAMAVPAALMLPNWGLNFLRRSYREALRRGLPDALDLMVVCAEAGLGFETTIERVATEIRELEPCGGARTRDPRARVARRIRSPGSARPSWQAIGSGRLSPTFLDPPANSALRHPAGSGPADAVA